MTRKNFFVELSDCIICEECLEETTMHLFSECSFSKSFRWTIGFEWNSDLDLNNMIIEPYNRYSHNFLIKTIITGCWSLWEQTNDAILKGVYPDVQRCLIRFKCFLMVTCIELNLVLRRPCNPG
jgi:hypothetical protein